jgi:hypothetical protein
MSSTQWIKILHPSTKSRVFTEQKILCWRKKDRLLNERRNIVFGEEINLIYSQNEQYCIRQTNIIYWGNKYIVSSRKLQISGTCFWFSVAHIPWAKEFKALNFISVAHIYLRHRILTFLWHIHTICATEFSKIWTNLKNSRTTKMQ